MTLTDEQRLALVEYQRGLLFHPFTCPMTHADGASWCDHVLLIPGADSWYCAGQSCDYTQDYADTDETMADFIIIHQNDGKYPDSYMDPSYS